MGYRQLNNPYKCLKCETRADDCECCETGWDEGYVDLLVYGCDGAPLRQLVLMTRHRSAATLPCGPASRYPADAPCGVFWGLVSFGETGCTGDDGEDWTGGGGFLIWCDRANPDMPYKGEVYCFDDNTDCYVYQGDLTLSNYRCTCNGPTFWVQLPTVDCCCAGGETVCCCGDTLVPNVLTASVEIGGVPAGDVTITRTGTSWVGTGTVDGIPVEITLACQEGPGGCFWGLTIDCGDEVLFVTLVDSSCDPFEINFFTENILSICFGGSVGVTVTP